MRLLSLSVVVLLIAACGGGSTSTQRPSVTSTAAPAITAAPAATDATSPEALCSLLNGVDWQQFNYVTAAQPDVTSDAPGTAICQYASGLFLEVYVDTSATDAEATYQTILENVPFDDPQGVLLIGADEAAFDSDIGDNHAGIAFRAGHTSFLITGLARETVLAELTTLAGLVLSRSAALH